jgi:hypothetical protein
MVSGGSGAVTRVGASNSEESDSSQIAPDGNAFSLAGSLQSQPNNVSERQKE